MTLTNSDNSPVIGTRKKLLKTGFPNGKRIEISIAQCSDCVLIDTDREFDFLESAPNSRKNGILNKLNMRFAGGQFHIKCSYDQYPKVLIEFTKYLEELVFSAMLKVEQKEAKNDNKDTSDSGNPDSGRNKKSDSNGNNVKNTKRKSKSLFSGVLSSSGRGEPTEGSGGNSEQPDTMAEKSD